MQEPCNGATDHAIRVATGRRIHAAVSRLVAPDGSIVTAGRAPQLYTAAVSRLFKSNRMWTIALLLSRDSGGSC